MDCNLKWLLLTSLIGSSFANPSSKPYIPFRTDPFDQSMNHPLAIPPDPRRPRPTKYNPSLSIMCPLQFTLGLSRRSHTSPDPRANAIIQPPTLFPVHPAYGPGRQILHTTQHEHLDLLTPDSLHLLQQSASPQQQTNKIIKEGLLQPPGFPLLFESSSFLGAPIVHDANGDGIPDAIVADYDGGLYFVGLRTEGNNNDKDSQKKNTKPDEHRRYIAKHQIPRLYIRKDWMLSRLNEELKTIEKAAAENSNNNNNNNASDTPGEEEEWSQRDPYHSYFEYGSKDANSQEVLRGVTASLLEQQNEELEGLEKRRKRRVNHQRVDEDNEGGGDIENEDEHDGEDSEDIGEKEGAEDGLFDIDHRRLEEESSEDGGGGDEHDEEHDEEHGGDDHHDGWSREEVEHHHDFDEISKEAYERIMSGEDSGEWHDDDSEYDYEGEEGDEENHDGGDYSMGDDYGYHGDDYAYGGYDDYYGGRYGRHDDFYDDKHYIRLPPHVLSTPVLADMKQLYGNDENARDEFLYMAVSYYFDEDEYEGFFSYKRFENTDKGDETEMSRGMHVASALVSFVLDNSPRFGREEHLDLSSDPTAPHNVTMVAAVPLRATGTKLGAFALSTPTIADIDGNNEEDILIGTSMGIIYCMHARHMYNIDGWPVQIKSPIESRILVEDVTGDTNLEIFVSDVDGGIFCFDTKGSIIWNRNLKESMSFSSDIRAMSPMTMGDVNGDGVLDIVMTFKTIQGSQWSTFMVAISAVTGNDLANFPMRFESPLPMDDGTAESGLLQKLPQALLIDLHAEQGHWKPYLYRNGTRWDHPVKERVKDSPHGGKAPGLHIVQPIGSNVFIVEGASACTQKIAIGEEIDAMVQADDVHGTNSIDLVVSTKSGNIVTLESPAVPYHPLNVWNTGEVRSRRNQFAQGFSASQGIFVHDISRRYRDIFGVYVPITFEIFDNRPNIQNEPNRRVYKVEVRDGTSARRSIMRKEYNEVGKYTERIYIQYGPGYYTLTVLLRTTHGLIYEDSFHLSYNVHYLDGFGLIMWIPLFVAIFPILFCSKKRARYDGEDDEDEDSARGRNQGILGISTSNS